MVEPIRQFLGDRSPFILVFVPLFLIYFATASHAKHDHIDPLTNTLTAWHLGMTGSVVMPDHADAATPEYQGNVGWIVESRRGPVSQYPPGAAALAAPLYAISGEPMNDAVIRGLNRPSVEAIPFPLPSPLPAAMAASLTAAAAIGLVAATIPLAGGTRVGGVLAGLVGGLATTFWATASNTLWQHGPAAMWVAAGIYLAARSKYGWSGLMFGAAIVTRPHLAVIAAALGVYIAVSDRRVGPAIKIASGSMAGLLTLLWFNWWAWGELTISGGYPNVFAERLVSFDLLSYVANVAGAVVDPLHGLFPYSPWLLALIPGFAAGWKRLPAWAKGAAVGGLMYILIQLKANRFSGGDGFLGYRYPLEALIAASVLFYFAYDQWVAERPMVMKAFWGAVAISVVPQVLWKLGLLPGSL